MEALKITEKIIRENAFENKENSETEVKFNPGLSANRPSNNWALVSKRPGFPMENKEIPVVRSLSAKKGPDRYRSDKSTKFGTELL